MKYLWRYLENEPKKFFQMARCFFFWFILCFLYAHFVILYDRQFVEFYLLDFKKALLFIYVALFEETFFRVLPFLMVYVFTQGREKYFKPLSLVALVLWSFMFFGFLHSYRAVNILYQGVGGLVMGIVYLKFGGMRGKILKPFFATAFFHWLWNAIMFSLLYIKISG